MPYVWPLLRALKEITRPLCAWSSHFLTSAWRLSFKLASSVCLSLLRYSRSVRRLFVLGNGGFPLTQLFDAFVGASVYTWEDKQEENVRYSRTVSVTITTVKYIGGTKFPRATKEMNCTGTPTTIKLQRNLCAPRCIKVVSLYHSTTCWSQVPCGGSLWPVLKLVAPEGCQNCRNFRFFRVTNL